MSKQTLKEGDLVDILKTYGNQIYNNLKNLDNHEEVKKDILKKIYEEYELDEADAESKNLLESKCYYVNKYVDNYLNKKEKEHKKRYKRIHNEIPDVLGHLKTLKLPEQRSEEWYKLRENVLTASSLADALGKGHFNTRESLLIDKTSTEKKPFITNDIIQWGVKFEPIATMYYELLNSVKIVEFGLVPHPELKIFGASPDGICDIDSPEDYVGRMLEIKCPPIRKFWEKPDVPQHYWMQMQGQLETCDLEECDFFQVKLLEYSNYEEYVNDKAYGYDQNILSGYRMSNTGLHPKGCLVELKKGNEISYEYPELCKTDSEYMNWATDIIRDNKDEYDNCKIVWWKIERYSCDLVGRDMEWWESIVPKIIDFWEDVEHYRLVGNDELIKKKEGRKRKKKVSKKTDDNKSITINMPEIKQEYLLDTSSDEDTKDKDTKVEDTKDKDTKVEDTKVEDSKGEEIKVDDV
jgi:putative phage-type endonuclease